MSVLRELGTRVTPQSEPVPGRSDQVKNNAGGYGFLLDDWARLERFLILGVDAGTYYVNAKALANDNMAVVLRCLDQDYRRAIDLIVQISDEGRAPKNDPAIFALAVAVSHSDHQARWYALRRLDKVCRIGTHLFTFAGFVENFRGWGRGLREAVSSWYERENVDNLAYQVVKYRSRQGWSHRDLLRLAHPEAPTSAHEAVFNWLCKREPGESLPRLIEGFERVQAATSDDQVARLVSEYGLPWEAVPSEFLTATTWNALLERGSLPMGALIRNLGVLTNRKVLSQGSSWVEPVATRLTNTEEIRKARVHPIAILNALLTYKGGVSRGGVQWSPVARVLDALDEGFYSSFATVEPAGKRTLVALDISGSMGWAPVANAAFNAAQGATAMSMVTVATEPEVITTAFSTNLIPVDVSPRRRLDDQVRDLFNIPMGGTDCALPMQWAEANQVPVDTFIAMTDNETWAGGMHPHQALQRYREKMGIDARLVVVGMTSTGFTIADPQDGGMLDVVGFDSAAPSVISNFSAKRF